VVLTDKAIKQFYCLLLPLVKCCSGQCSGTGTEFTHSVLKSLEKIQSLTETRKKHMYVLTHVIVQAVFIIILFSLEEKKKSQTQEQQIKRTTDSSQLLFHYTLEVLLISSISIYPIVSVVHRIIVQIIKKKIKKNETCFNAFIFKVNARQHFESVYSSQLKRNFSNSNSDMNHVMLSFAIN